MIRPPVASEYAPRYVYLDERVSLVDGLSRPIEGRRVDRLLGCFRSGHRCRHNAVHVKC